MRISALIVIGLLFSLVPNEVAAAPPTVKITKVERGKKGRISLLDFHIKAHSTYGIRRIMYFVTVDGKKSGWVRYPYYDVPGYKNHLPFRVDCNRFTFMVYSIDKKGRKSRIQRRAYSNLR